MTCRAAWRAASAAFSAPASYESKRSPCLLLYRTYITHISYHGDSPAHWHFESPSRCRLPQGVGALAPTFGTAVPRALAPEVEAISSKIQLATSAARTPAP